MALLKADLCVIGAGSAGLSVAAGAAMLGLKVVLIEKGEMGGDCLNTGCVPSKALIAAGSQAHTQSTGAAFGISPMVARIDYKAVHDHVKRVIETIAPIDSQERFEGLGVTVIRAPARFTGRAEVEAGETTVRARRFVVATGSRPLVPPIPGLDRIAYHTNETIFDLQEKPSHLIVIGAGPIGVELGQAMRRLGAEVTLVDGARALGREDPELTAIVLERLHQEGVRLHEETRVTAVRPSGGGIELSTDGKAGAGTITGSHLLVAVGRTAHFDGLDLDKAHVQSGAHGIRVDARLRTSNRRIYAIGDVVGGPQFTHVAGYHASVVVRDALFRVPTRVDYGAIPRVTYTDPELAAVGLNESEARARYGARVRVVRHALHDNDRAQAERQTEGLIKVVALNNGRVLGAGIAAPHAGDLIVPWIFAVQGKIKLSDLASVVMPYPTVSEISKRAASAFYKDAVFGRTARMLVGLLQRIG